MQALPVSTAGTAGWKSCASISADAPDRGTRMAPGGGAGGTGSARATCLGASFTSSQANDDRWEYPRSSLRGWIRRTMRLSPALMRILSGIGWHDSRTLSHSVSETLVTMMSWVERLSM